MQRGRCGSEPIGPECEDASRDGPALPHLGREFDDIRGGWYVRDSAFLRTPFAADDRTEAGRWRVCPTSEMRRVLPIVHMWRRHKLGVETAPVRVPSAALVEAFEVLAVADIEVENAAIRLITGEGNG